MSRATIYRTTYEYDNGALEKKYKEKSQQRNIYDCSARRLEWQLLIINTLCGVAEINVL